MNAEKQKLHERLLDAQDAILITCEGDQVSIDVMGELVSVGEGLAYALAQNTDLADFFLSVMGGTVITAAKIGDIKKSEEIRKALEGVLLYLQEAKGKAYN